LDWKVLARSLVIKRGSSNLSRWGSLTTPALVIALHKDSRATLEEMVDTTSRVSRDRALDNNLNIPLRKFRGTPSRFDAPLSLSRTTQATPRVHRCGQII